MGGAAHILQMKRTAPGIGTLPQLLDIYVSSIPMDDFTISSQHLLLPLFDLI
jgi:hypothetical protein